MYIVVNYVLNVSACAVAFRDKTCVSVALMLISLHAPPMILGIGFCMCLENEPIDRWWTDDWLIIIHARDTFVYKAPPN